MIEAALDLLESALPEGGIGGDGKAHGQPVAGPSARPGRVVAAGAARTLGLRADGAVLAMGANTYGHRGLSALAPQPEPRRR
ncbi:hypothetical protein J5X07_02295 [Actinomyces bowdenii]|uniref:Uncharacterized protein n=1 Tax=Actinomyces bowdenii TaxID=131109 RepID=A0A3P1V8I5_9ACTO|nr:RCC1 domain-containing protein [Actinomyces bowdenii]MBO3723874.1 hypothetical protein [Actinomyces bowdenii]RRD29956.1 hypothetical protein EII10_04505 [Actinomyces bowdenii]